jgi:putative peptide zinc metalloprotease protein
MSQDFHSANWYRVAEVRPRLAPELRAQRQRWRGKVWYVLFDPLNQRTHRLTPQAWFLVSRMDGTQSVAQLWAASAAALGEQAPPQDEVIQLLAQLHEADALASDTLPDLEDLGRRRDRTRRQLWKRSLANPLSLRLHLWDPDAFLQRTLPWAQALFSPLAAMLWLAIVLPAAVLAWMHWGEVSGNASDALLSASNLLTMVLVYPGLKLLHELAHAYAARKGGAEVHDMGLMFLVFMPMPYVDASGSTAFARKTERALVAAAGMLTELLLAALAMLLWLSVEPGAVRSLAFSVMLLGGASTLLFNGNPLLRFDGYYVLCDLIEVPNLAQRGTQYWQWLIKHHLFGLDQAQRPESTRGERAWFLAYTPLALGYRIFITISIALFLGQEYLYLGLALGAWGIATQFVWPCLKGLRYVWSSTELVGRRGRPIAVTAGLGMGLAVLALAVPMPMSSYAQGVVWPPESTQLRAGEAGFVTLVRGVPGQQVEPGAVVALLDNDRLDTERETAEARSSSERARYIAALAQASRSVDTTKARVQTAVGESAWQRARSDQAHATAKQGDLRIVAGRGGQLEIPMAPDLPGRWLRKGESVGHVVTGEAPTVRVIVTQDDIDLVRAQLTGVRVRLAGQSGEVWAAQLVREVPGGDASLPSLALALENGGTVAVDMRDPQQPRTLSKVFQFDLRLPAEAGQALIGERAHVRFVHVNEPLALQLWRRVRQLLLSRLDL